MEVDGIRLWHVDLNKLSEWVKISSEEKDRKNTPQNDGMRYQLKWRMNGTVLPNKIIYSANFLLSQKFSHFFSADKRECTHDQNVEANWWCERRTSFLCNWHSTSNTSCSWITYSIVMWHKDKRHYYRSLPSKVLMHVQCHKLYKEACAWHTDALRWSSTGDKFQIWISTNFQ